MKIRKELWFGFSLMALILAGVAVLLLSADTLTRGHLGLVMLALVVVAIMLGFPTAFTLMGMGMIFTWFAYDRDTSKTLTLMVQSAFKVMGNDVLISIPLFVFMGYLVERANLIEKLFRSLHLAMARVPGSLAVATLLTCAVLGPLCAHSMMAFTASAGPCTLASTAPLARLRTQPARPSAVARSASA